MAEVGGQVVKVMHPDKSMLLAHVRRQRCNEWPGGLKQHIDDCPQCQVYCNECAQVSTLIEAWTHSSVYQGYPSITDHVFQRLAQSQSVSRPQRISVQSMRSLRVASLSAALVLALLCTSILIALAYQSGSLPFIPGLIVSPKSLTVVPNENSVLLTPQPSAGHGQQPIKTHTPTDPTATPGEQPTETPSANGPTIWQCNAQSGPPQSDSVSGQTQLGAQPGSTQASGRHMVLSICGTQFTPNNLIALRVRFSGYPALIRALTRSDAQGNFHVTFSIPDCSFVPASIVAVNVTHPNEVSQVLTGIQVGNCPIPPLPPTSQPYPGLPPDVGLPYATATP